MKPAGASIVRSAPPRLQPPPLREALRSVVGALRSIPDRSMIVGGVAVIAHGVARPTRGVDATISSVRDVSRLFFDVERYGVHPRIDDAVEFARAHQMLPLRHRPTDVDVNLWLAWRPFELDALAAAVDVLLGSVEATVARPEDLVIYKALAWRPLDQEDAERLVALHGRTMSFERVWRTVLENLGATEGTGRVRELERVVERALGRSQ